MLNYSNEKMIVLFRKIFKLAFFLIFGDINTKLNNITRCDLERLAVLVAFAEPIAVQERSV